MQNKQNIIEINQNYKESFKNMSEKVLCSDKFDPELYGKYNVKRGLRNQDGTGVLVGLTSIGDVRAYIMEENEKVPIDGKLVYRGMDVRKLVEGTQRRDAFGFEETVYLLLTGMLPTQTELDEFNKMLGDYRKLPEGFAEDMIMKAPSPNIMNKLARCVLASYSYDENPDDLSFDNVLRQCIMLIAQLPTMAAYAYQTKSHYYDDKSLYIHNPQSNLSTSENFLQMIRPDSKYTKLEAEMLDLALVLHAEHGGGNNSTFAVHVVSSSGTDTYSAMATAIGALKGHKHGGANLKVMDMIDDMKKYVTDKKSEKQIEDYLLRVLNKEVNDGSGLIYGIGHAVYTISDPRAILLKNKAEELADSLGGEWKEEFEFYKRIEKVAPSVFDKFKHSSKSMCANVDFYSGLVYTMLNIPKELYTPIFAISRIAGWSAHRLEELAVNNRIMRPAYKNVGKKQPYTELDQRV
ncbi:MAG: citrate/2-methylcitrate synthase [Ruminococcaceae bacterium]|nr:citrate/2-methylcitrate synthase [Oscillospiraceae bacterium]